MRAAEARERSGQLSPDQAASERKELLMRYYRATGPAKVKETCNYLLGLLHREGAPGAAGGGGRGGGRSGRGAGAAEDEFDGSDGKVRRMRHAL